MRLSSSGMVEPESVPMERFAPVARPWLEADALRATVALTALGTAECADPSSPSEAWWVRDADSLRVVAIRNVGHPIVIHGDDARAALALAQARADAEGAGEVAPLTAVFGLDPIARAFADAFSRLAGTTIADEIPMRLLATSAVVPPSPRPAGRARLASTDERAELIELYGAFLASLDAPKFDPAPIVDAALDQKRMHVWDASSHIVCLVMNAADSPRISAVFTPVEHRGRGYAAACVASVTDELLARGAPFLCLFADKRNATSTGVYRRVGYRDVDDYVELRFESR